MTTRPQKFQLTLHKQSSSAKTVVVPAGSRKIFLSPFENNWEEIDQIKPRRNFNSAVVIDNEI